MVTKEKAKHNAIEHVKKEKNNQEVNVTEIVKTDSGNWKVSGTVSFEPFIVEIDDKGNVVSSNLVSSVSSGKTVGFAPPIQGGQSLREK